MMHHALLVEGRYEWALTCLPDVCRIEGVDVIHYRGVRMGIDEVRMLTGAAHQTPFELSARHFVLAYGDITREAQNALLKIFEDPPHTARFYLVIEERETLLPTLRSRMVAYDTERTEHDALAASAFMSSSYAERLTRIAERTTKKDEVWCEKVFRAIEGYAATSEDTTLMRAVVSLRPYFRTPGASKKMILEHLSLMLPKA